MDVIDETSNYNLKKLDIWDFDVIKNRQEIIYNQYLHFTSKSGESKE
jgi:hypothetical protein